MTRDQTRAFPEMEQNESTILSKGKPGFPGGMKIPPILAEIRRPRSWHMTIEDLDKIDITSIVRKSGDVILVICDHLDWTENEGEHLLVLQNKLNAYSEFIECGKIDTKLLRAIGHKIIIEVVGKFPLSEEAKRFYRLAGKAIEDLGYSLRFRRPESE